MRGSDGPHFARLLCVAMRISAHLAVVLLHSHDGVIGKACKKKEQQQHFSHILMFLDRLEW